MSIIKFNELKEVLDGLGAETVFDKLDNAEDLHEDSQAHYGWELMKSLSHTVRIDVYLDALAEAGYEPADDATGGGARMIASQYMYKLCIDELNMYMHYVQGAYV